MIYELPESRWNELRDVARDVAKKAHAPYSKFYVGAALLTEDGTIIPGCNVENASFGATICAERSAVVSAVSQGYTDFIALAIYNSSSDPAAPCGICRQFLAEFCAELPMLLFGEGHTHIVATLSDLLPYRFSGDSL